MSVSLCITSYDQDCDLIYDLLDEFKKQTFSPKEIIFYCSGINQLNIPNFININSNKIPIYTIFSLKRTNQAKARNICSSVADAEYCMFFDVDDIPHPMKLSITHEIINNTNCDFLLHNYKLIHSRSNICDQLDKYYNIYPINEFDKQSTNVVCGSHPIHHSHLTVKKTVFNKIKFNESLTYYRKEDGKFCQDLIINQYAGIYCPLKLVNYYFIPKNEMYIP